LPPFFFPWPDRGPTPRNDIFFLNGGPLNLNEENPILPKISGAVRNKHFFVFQAVFCFIHAPAAPANRGGGRPEGGPSAPRFSPGPPRPHWPCGAACFFLFFFRKNKLQNSLSPTHNPRKILAKKHHRPYRPIFSFFPQFFFFFFFFFFFLFFSPPTPNPGAKPGFFFSALSRGKKIGTQNEGKPRRCPRFLNQGQI